MLLTIGSRVENTGMRWNSRRSNLSDWGGFPTRIELVVGKVTLRGLSNAKAVSAQPLDGSGAVMGELSRAQKTSAGWEILLGKAVTTWYQISVTR
jgi:hypothetical protein